MPDGSLVGRRVLAVEDEYFLADELARALRGAGALVLGPLPSVKAALDLLEREVPDVAVLDVNLGGERADPVADALQARGIPFMFTTGYDQSALPERYAAVRHAEKPVDVRIILGEVGHLLGIA